MAVLGRNAYARHRGCAPNAVAKAMKKRIAAAVVLDMNGRFVGIDADLADRLWRLNTDIDQQIRGNGGVMPNGPAVMPGAGGSAVPSPGGLGGAAGSSEALPLGEYSGDAPAGASAPGRGDADAGALQARDESLRGQLLESKLRQQLADTELRELDAAKRRGELVAVADVRQAGFRRYRSMRDKLLTIPDRLAAQLAAERDPVMVHAAIAREVKQVLDELSAGARESARDAGDGVDAKDADQRLAA